MVERINGRGFLSFKENGSRLVLKGTRGLSSTDLGCITFEDAHQKAWTHGVPLLINGRIRGRASIVPCASNG